jgi:hypothetical protein
MRLGVAACGGRLFALRIEPARRVRVSTLRAAIANAGAPVATRVVRGGSWNNQPDNLRSANRNRS